MSNIYIGRLRGKRVSFFITHEQKRVCVGKMINNVTNVGALSISHNLAHGSTND